MTSSHRVLVLYPRGVQTGGPEAIHQLVAQLREDGIQAFLVPLPETAATPPVPDYAGYGCEEVPFEDVWPSDLLIFPEMNVSMLDESVASHKAVWWLSIDNSPAFFSVRSWLRGEQGAVDLRRVPGLVRRSARAAALRRRLRRSDIRHFAQSAYARDTVEQRLGATATMLTDYTTAPRGFPTSNDATRANRVAFNPRKGAAMAERVQKMTKGIEFVPLIDIPREDMTAVLGSCAIYLDTGHHPGKDRLPREAALAGCVVLVALRGSGAFYEDVPLTPEYKFADAGEARTVLEAAMADPDRYRDGMAAYVRSIGEERIRFADEVHRAFALR